MKRTFAYIFSLLLLLVGTSQLSFAQKDGKGSRAGNWFLGLNAGGAWNQSDVCIEPGGGLGFYVGKNIEFSTVLLVFSTQKCPKKYGHETHQYCSDFDDFCVVG